MIEYHDYTKSYALACDRCGRRDAVRTARSVAQAEHIAATVLKWTTDTPLGILCPSCTVLWRNGALERDGAEAPGEFT